MAEDLCISNGSKAEKYQTLLPQIKSLIEGENDLIANLANVSAALKETLTKQMHVFLKRYAPGSEDCVEVIKYKIGITEK